MVLRLHSAISARHSDGTGAGEGEAGRKMNEKRTEAKELSRMCNIIE